MGEKIQFYPLDITYKIKDNKADIYIFGRTTEGRQICVIDKDFRPYFSVILKKEEDIESFSSKVKKIEVEEKEKIAKALDTEVIEKNYLGKKTKVVKVYVNLPHAVPMIRYAIKDWNMIKGVFEYDLHFARRYLLDKQITPLTITEVEGEYINENLRVKAFKLSDIKPVSDDSLSKPKVLSFDIETYAKEKTIDMQKNPILMISFHSEDFQKVITWKKFKTDEKYIEFVDGEAELIEKFKEILNHYRPDMLAGYFSDGFDLPYIIERAKKYNIDLDIGLDFSKLNYNKGRTTMITIGGIIHFDVFRFIKKNFGRSLNTDSYSLQSVATELLGEGKEEVNLDNLADIWDNHPEKLEKFCSYCLQDSALVTRLTQRVWPNVLEFVKIISLSPLDITQMSFSQLVESYIMKKSIGFNEVILNRPHYNEEMERRQHRYEGAFVYEPTPGFYKDIVVFDFRSLYPTIIVSHNIGPSTLCIGENKNSPECVSTPDKEYGFLKHPKGFLPTILEELITRRARVKTILKDKKDPLLEARSQSLKLLANSFYGYLGFSGARWYCLECATSVTSYGRYYINKVIDEAKKEGFGVVYGDTDSVFMTLGDKKQEEAIKFVEDINDKLPGMMELEFEGHYPYGIFVSTKSNTGGAKKRYALIDDDGKMTIKGFEMVRRNWSEIGKTVQENVLNIILKENDPEKALKYIKKTVNEVKEKKIPNELMVIKTQITKPIDEYASIGPHVAVAKKLIAKGEKIPPGTVVGFIITPGKGVLRDRAILPEDAKQGDYDADYYIESQIIPVIDKILEVLGYTKDEILSKHTQKDLSSFFS